MKPTFWSILKRNGILAAINFAAERICIREFVRMHRDAERRGYNLCAPDYKQPWWFTLASKVEWYTRPKKRGKH